MTTAKFASNQNHIIHTEIDRRLRESEKEVITILNQQSC